MFVWLRGTLPRMRYDQFMSLGWKVLVPGSLVWIVLVFAARALRGSAVTPGEILVVGGFVLVILLVVAFLLPQRQPVERTDDIVTAGSDYPLPPLDLVVPPSPPRRAAVGAGVSSTAVSGPAGSTNGAPPPRQEDGHGTA